MKFEVIEGLNTIGFNLVGTVALAVLLLQIGNYLKGHSNLLQKFCIPAPVIGGFLFSILALLLKVGNVANFTMDTTMQSPLMIAFFTTVGLGGSFSLLKKGGAALVIYWVLCCILSITQNIIGAGIASATGIHPILGVMAGAASMVGGHGGAAAFGETAELMGVTGALTVGAATATFGLISGSLLGGPVARYLINKYNLKPTGTKYQTAEEALGDQGGEVDYANTMKNLLILLVMMVIGTIFGSWLTGVIASTTGNKDLALPGYVGAMFVAVFFRNLNDKFHFVKIDFKVMDLFGDVSLGIFLSMALMTLKLWELRDLLGPMLIIVIAQVVFIVLYCIFVVFRLCGKDFDAAVMVSGLMGHGLGATPNAVANMASVTEQLGPSSKAFLIVPLVGAFLVDIVHIPNIVFFMNLFA